MIGHPSHEDIEMDVLRRLLDSLIDLGIFHVGRAEAFKDSYKIQRKEIDRDNKYKNISWRDKSITVFGRMLQPLVANGYITYDEAKLVKEGFVRLLTTYS